MNVCSRLLIILSINSSMCIAQAPGIETLSLQTADEMAAGLASNDFARVDSAIAHISGIYGMSEVTLRVKILSKIMRGMDVADDIRTYYDNDFNHRTSERVRRSRQSDFGYRYEGMEKYFDYVPLRHPIDAITADIAIDQLTRLDLTKDERLLCTLFSGNLEDFEVERKPHNVKEAYGNERLRSTLRVRSRERLAFVLYSGIYSPIGDRDIFGNNPSIGLSIGSPLEYNFTLEIAMKFRINHNDRPFQYYSMDSLYTVDSGHSVFFGAILGYKLYDRNTFIIQPKIGVGGESVSTGLTSYNKNSSDPNNNTDYDDLATLHASASIAAMKLLGARHYLGVEVGFHFTPYSLDKHLKTSIDNTALSAELFFRL